VHTLRSASTDVWPPAAANAYPKPRLNIAAGGLRRLRVEAACGCSDAQNRKLYAVYTQLPLQTPHAVFEQGSQLCRE
jgi:hypothetical protein